MVAVELINRLQQYDDGTIMNFSLLPVRIAEEFIDNLDIEIQALIKMINDALKNVSISYCYSVPYINLNGGYYGIKTKNFASEVKKKKKDIVVDEGVTTGAATTTIEEELWSDTDDSDHEDIVNNIEYTPLLPSVSGGAANGGATSVVEATADELLNELGDRIQGREEAADVVDSDDENTAIQRAIVASLEK